VAQQRKGLHKEEGSTISFGFSIKEQLKTSEKGSTGSVESKTAELVAGAKKGILEGESGKKND